MIENDASELSFSEYGVNEYKILAGNSIRPLENEIKVSLSVKAVLNSESYEFSYIIKKIYKNVYYHYKIFYESWTQKT